MISSSFTKIVVIIILTSSIHSEQNDDSPILRSATLYNSNSNVTLRIRRDLQQLRIANDHKDNSINLNQKQTPSELFNSINELSRGGLVCNLCIVVDQEFADAYKLKEATEIIIFFRKLIDRISWIFRNIDWNGDGLSDNIGFEVISLVKGWTPYPTEYSGSYARPKPAMELLGIFAQNNFHHCCLGVGFTNRPFEHNQVGVSFIASDNLLGGICDFRNPSPPLVSANVALISAVGLKGTQLSENDLSNVLRHELGHTFGVLKHDMDLEPKCSGYDTGRPIPADYISDKKEPPNGRFIMWGQDIQGSQAAKINNLNFSPCSRSAVAKVLYSGMGRGKCLTLGQNESPFCGNGIVEFPEECDCGNELSCSQDACCGPRGSSDPCLLYKGIDIDKCTVMSEGGGDGTKANNRAKSNEIKIKAVSFFMIVLFL